MPEVKVSTFSVPVKDLVSGAARLCFDGKCMTVFNPIEGSEARKAMDAALEASPSSSSAFPSGATTTDEDPEMSLDDYRAWCGELGLTDEQIDALIAKHFGAPAEDEEGGEEPGAHPPDFTGRPKVGGEMVKSAQDIMLAVDKLPTKQQRKAALRNLAGIGAGTIAGRATGTMAQDAGSKVSIADVFQRFPHARALKMAMDANPGGFIARQNAQRLERMRQVLIDEAKETAAEPMATDSAGDAVFGRRFPGSERIKILG